MIYGEYDEDDAAEEVRKWTCERDTGIKYEDIRGLYMTDDISREKVQNLYVTYGGYSKEAAAGRADTFEFVRSHPTCKDISDSGVAKYQEFCKPAGISGESYYDIWKYYNTTDSDYVNGKAVRNSKKDKVMEYINRQSLSRSQKDAIYLSFGWSRRSIGRAPWN